MFLRRANACLSHARGYKLHGIYSYTQFCMHKQRSIPLARKFDGDRGRRVNPHRVCNKTLLCDGSKQFLFDLGGCLCLECVAWFMNFPAARACVIRRRASGLGDGGSSSISGSVSNNFDWKSLIQRAIIYIVEIYEGWMLRKQIRLHASNQPKTNRNCETRNKEFADKRYLAVGFVVSSKFRHFLIIHTPAEPISRPI